jgi:hypothetical protein
MGEVTLGRVLGVVRWWNVEWKDHGPVAKWQTQRT